MDQTTVLWVLGSAFTVLSTVVAAVIGAIKLLWTRMVQCEERHEKCEEKGRTDAVRIGVLEDKVATVQQVADEAKHIANAKIVALEQQNATQAKQIATLEGEVKRLHPDSLRRMEDRP